MTAKHVLDVKCPARVVNGSSFMDIHLMVDAGLLSFVPCSFWQMVKPMKRAVVVPAKLGN